MLAIYSSKSVTPGVNLRECISCMPPPNVNKAIHSGFETQRNKGHQKSETQVSLAQKKDLCPWKFEEKK